MSKYFSGYLTLCPQCNKYPFISFNKNKPQELLIQCDNCKYNKNISIHNYLHIMKTSFEQINHQSSYVNLSSHYCITCKLYLCDQLNMHSSHLLIDLDNVISTADIIKELTNGYNHINVYCDKLKNNAITNYINKINQIEFSYHSFKEINM